MAKQLRYVVMVPVEITLDSHAQLRKALRSIRDNGPFPELDSFGEQCYSWRTRHDLARLKNVKQVVPDPTEGG